MKGASEDAELAALLPDAAAIGRALVDWFRATCRDLPWRRDSSDPYRVWVSEIMLQQTQVATVEPYYERWVRRFPTLRSLAEADIKDVLRHWEGLGYYGRARRLHEAARVVFAQHGGTVPHDVENLRRLPGIGEYTAGAIAAIAFGMPTVALDANARRVLRRIVGADMPDAALRTIGKTMIPPGAAGAFVQSLFELGATICTARRADCETCPVEPWCKAHAAGNALGVGHSRPSPRTTRLIHAAAIVECERRVLLVRRRPEGLWADLWEFPWRDMANGETAEQCAMRAAREVAGVEAEAVGTLCTVRHTVTHYAIRLHAVHCRTATPCGRPLDCAELVWLPWDALDGFPMPSPHRKIVRTAASRFAAASDSVR